MQQERYAQEKVNAKVNATAAEHQGPVVSRAFNSLTTV
jgi:hypothetical protein